HPARRFVPPRSRSRPSMTATLEESPLLEELPPSEEQEEEEAHAPGATVEEGEPEEQEDDTGPILRPLLVAGLASAAAALETGGIFGSWPARILAAAGAVLGVFWAFLALKSKRRVIIQALVLPVAFVAGLIALVPASNGGPSEF